MIFRHLRALRDARSSDSGLALPTVFGIGIVMLILVAASLSTATSATIRTKTDGDWNGALSAAYAGVEEYQSRLANDGTYTKYGNPAAVFSRTSSALIVAPAVPNPAFGIGNAWASVPGSDGQAQFRYEVDTTAYASSGRVRLRSTGKVGSRVRSIVADLKQYGFIDYLYFTDYEVQDPQFTGKAFCANRYAYGDNARPVGTGPSDCQPIQFAPNDAFDGPVHSNDKLVICGTRFNKPVTSSSTEALWETPTNCADSKPPILRAKKITIPDTNASDRKETFANDPSIARPGCLYTGPTKITFYMNGSTEMMNVVSPWTKQTNPYPGERSGTSLAQCGTPAALQSTSGANVRALAANLIFVQNVPADTANVNGWATNRTPGGFTCRNIAGVGGWSFGSSQYPIANESAPDGSSADAPAYGCRNGDAFAQGKLGSALTVSADNYIYVTGDLTYADTAKDMLGLVGNNGVIVWNPVRAYDHSYSSLLSSGYDRTIFGAILSVQHTFQVQNFSRVPRGTLAVTGSIAQKYRGPVGQGNNGYVKAYGYEPRFLSTAPPKFITPTSTTYKVTQYAAVGTAFNADGSATGR